MIAKSITARHVAELERENAELRDDRERLFRKYVKQAHEVLDTHAENNELRELVRVMAYCMQYERECDECRMNGADGIITAPVGCDGLSDRMRELGIEVDA